MKKILASLFLLSLIFSGCMSPQPAGKPKWTLMPPNDGHIYGIGISQRHIRGTSAQRLYAISLALDEIAKQKNITVSNTFEKLEKVAGGNSSKSMQTYSIQSVDGVKISARIVDAYMDTNTDEIYILMKEE